MISINSDAVVVVLAANDAFSPMLAVTLLSIAENSNKNRKYEVVILQSDFSVKTMELLEKQCEVFPNVRLSFFNPKPIIEGFDLKKNPHDHISMETYYRFLIPEVLPDLMKVLYLDSDLVVDADVGLVFDQNLEGKMVAAVKDVDFIGRLNHPDRIAMDYAKKTLELKDPYRYFQAGVLLLNLGKMRKIRPTSEWLRLASEREYRYNDQDILNKYCQNDVLFLDMKYNCLSDCGGIRQKVIASAPEEIKVQYSQARKDPKIIHYAGKVKPWNDIDSDYSEVFWNYAQRSAFLTQLKSIAEHKRKKSAIDKLLPHGSRRRGLAMKIYYSLKGK